METKTRNIVVAVVVISVICVGTLIIFNPGLLAPSTQIHYEMTMSDTKYVLFSLQRIQDCNLRIVFEDNENLMYRLDAELYDSSETMTFDYSVGTQVHRVNINTGTTTRAKSINITLGTGHPYYFILGSSYDTSRNVSSTIIFDNNATLGGQEFAYYFPGSLNLIFTEDLDYSQGGYEVSIGGYNYEIGSVTLSVNLPDGMDGDVDFTSESISVSATGWTLYSDTINPPSKAYRTSASPTKPLLDISSVYGDSILATLVN